MTDRYCVMRDCLNHPSLAAWPITVLQLVLGAPGICRTDADDARIEVFEGEDGRHKAIAIAKEMDDRPSLSHMVENLEWLRFDVWLHNSYDGSTHVQAEGIAFDEARLLFLACVGFVVMHNRMTWKAHMHVPCVGHRNHWRRTDRPVDIGAGRWEYDARAATISQSWAEQNSEAERMRING